MKPAVRAEVNGQNRPGRALEMPANRSTVVAQLNPVGIGTDFDRLFAAAGELRQPWLLAPAAAPIVFLGNLPSTTPRRPWTPCQPKNAGPPSTNSIKMALIRAAPSTRDHARDLGRGRAAGDLAGLCGLPGRDPTVASPAAKSTRVSRTQ
jgi:hypothetical protein